MPQPTAALRNCRGAGVSWAKQECVRCLAQETGSPGAVRQVSRSLCLMHALRRGGVHKTCAGPCHAAPLTRRADAGCAGCVAAFSGRSSCPASAALLRTTHQAPQRPRPAHGAYARERPSGRPAWVGASTPATRRRPLTSPVRSPPARQLQPGGTCRARAPELDGRGAAAPVP